MGSTVGTPELELGAVTVTFGGITALTDVGLTVAPRQVHGVIGPNGAGKTTLFNVACGFVTPDAGRIVRRGDDVTGLRPHELPGLGMARTLQGLDLFDRVTVLENVMVGADRHARTGFLGSLLALPRASREERELRDRARRPGHRRRRGVRRPLPAQPPVRRPEARRAGPGAGRGAVPAAARRARQRPVDHGDATSSASWSAASPNGCR